MSANPYDSTKIRPTRGKMLVEIIEQLGGVTQGGIFLPAAIVDKAGKDTAMVRVLRVGPKPFVRKATPSGWIITDVKEPDGFCDYQEGDVALFPRDVPMVFGFQEKRYAIVLQQDGIAQLDGVDSDNTSGMLSVSDVAWS